MGKQIEIIALIEIRTVFKDLDNTSTWPWEASFFPHIHSALLLGGILVVFYTEFFTTLILVDVLILVVSLRYLHDFGQVIRNSGFIVATVMPRRALSIEPWHAFAYEVNAAILAVLMVLLQRYLPRRSKT